MGDGAKMRATGLGQGRQPRGTWPTVAWPQLDRRDHVSRNTLGGDGKLFQGQKGSRKG